MRRMSDVCLWALPAEKRRARRDKLPWSRRLAAPFSRLLHFFSALLVLLLSNHACAIEILDASAPAPEGAPRVSIAIDGDVYLGAWRKIEGRISPPKTPAGDPKLLEVRWSQLVGPKLATTAEPLDNAELWVFLTKPGNYGFTFRAKNESGWSAPAEIRFAVMSGALEISEKEGLKTAGSGERVVLPGAGWRQIAGPPAVLRLGDGGAAFRPNDAGLYIFEAARLEGMAERRGIRVPAAKDGKAGDRRPTAVLPRNLTGAAGRPVILDGSLSSDPDSEDMPLVKARWHTPDTSRGAKIEPQAGLHAAFTAERPGTYRVELSLWDGRLESATASVFIEISAAGAAGKGDPSATDAAKELFLRRVSLAIWPPEPDAEGVTIVPDDSGLERAVQLFSARCGVGLAINPSIARPGHFKDFPLALEAANTPLRHLLDGIARQTGTRYRRDADRAVWLVKPKDSMLEEPLEPVAAGVDALHEKPDAADLLMPLMPWLKPMLARDGTSLTFDNERLVGMLPKTAGAHLREIAGVLREPVVYGVPALEAPGKDEEGLRKLLGEKTLTRRGRFRLDHLLRDISQQAGLAIGFDHRLFPKGLPYVKIAYENAPLRQVLRDLVDEAGFDGCSIEPPAGIWFYKGKRPFPSGESLWETAVVRSYDLTPVFAALTPQAAALLNGETISHAIRSRIYPPSWSDPGTLLFYHAGTHKLIVLHAPETQRRVVELLNDICERGEWMLGPSN